MKNILCFLFLILGTTIYSSDVSVSSIAVPGGNHYQGAANILAYMIQMDVSGTSVTLNQLSMVTSGTYDLDDVSIFRLYRNTLPTLAGATQISFDNTLTGVGETISYGLNQLLGEGTHYFMIAFSLNNHATEGNTIHLDGGMHPASYTFTTSPNITDNQSNLAVTHSIDAADMSVSTIAVAGGNHYQGAANILAYMIQMDVSGTTVTLNQLSMVTSGTYDLDDVSIFRLYRNTLPTLAGATQISFDNTLTGVGETISYGLNQLLGEGTHYFMIAFSLSNHATEGHAIHLDGGMHPASYTFTTSPNITDDQSNLAGKHFIGFLWYEDLDGDGYGNENQYIYSSPQPTGYVSISGDCDDSKALIHPGAVEICDGIDNNCDGLIDDADPGISGQLVWYQDLDGDGYGNASVTLLSCSQPIGYVSISGDCDDSNPLIHPGVMEICDGIDNNCDGLIDNADPGISGQSVWYQDLDGDGYGNASVTLLTCSQPIGYVSISGDCDDSNPLIHPGTVEICDGIDNNCDGLIDNADPGITGQMVWYQDLDGDGYGNASVTLLSCSQPTGYVSISGDCDDSNALIHPGAVEICDGIDNNCDGLIDESPDLDGDGICDDFDNCPDVYNPDQIDSNNNGIGDACDNDLDDLDGDGIPDLVDNCPYIFNPDQIDSDCDGVGDICDECPGIDDSIDNDQDGLPDCKYLPQFSNIIASWKCGKNKVFICKVTPGKKATFNTICVAYNAAGAHINNGSYLGPCGSVNCNEYGFDNVLNANSITDYISNDLEVFLYPTPTYDRIYFEIFDYYINEFTIDIFNLQGQKVIPTFSGGSQILSGSIDMSSHQSGLYFFRISTASKIITKRIFKI